VVGGGGGRPEGGGGREGREARRRGGHLAKGKRNPSLTSRQGDAPHDVGFAVGDVVQPLVSGGPGHDEQRPGGQVDGSVIAMFPHLHDAAPA